MFSRRLRRPKSPDALKAWECLDRGDLPGALRLLRAGAEGMPLVEVALVAGRAAEAAGFEDVREAAEAVVGAPQQARALYDFGYACVERGVAGLAVPALREALRLTDGATPVLRELVAAYEDGARHREAADVLLAHETALDDWPDRYLLVLNAVLAGDLALARRQHALLGDPGDEMWLPARARQTRALERADAAGTVSPLDRADLRGWQYVMGGTVLGTLSPYGYDAGMNGRFAWLQDTYGQCLRGLSRLTSVLAAAQVRPASVSLLPDRSSRILGLAAAEVLGLPAVPFDAARADTVVIAYDLNETAETEDGPEILGALFDRTPGQVLHEHASCWTDPPAVTPDSATLLCQAVTAPWGDTLRLGDDGQVERGGPDERPQEEIAAEIVHADPTPDQGDGATPDDPGERLTEFVTAVRATWLRGDRARVRSTGPVPSGRFA
ncbi:hypothetical protein IAG44_04430 [Streptomyces roseirectus]|uniref:Tetratricopeptide repeat protein n=1 Tax=Streptomyces roseirectus TaxID=2768066 RepID=A0A7H0I7L5_9ACTN|nr:hypothetical protein [Streptomyces roseirectus]QNP68781.1 hypothetical protein IAG44_04430 [Streptomyces roseirectus]